MPQPSKSGTTFQIAFILSPERGDEGVVVFISESKLSDGVFFNVESYRGKVVPIEQLIEETYTYFAEHLRVPTIRRAYWNGNRWRHPDGTTYDDVFNQAIESATRQDIHYRYESEKEGWQKAGAIADKLEPFLIISLPGTVYRNQYGAKNMTYYANPIGKEGVEIVYDILSIPSEEMNGETHTEAVFGVVGEVIERDPDYLVSHPCIATAMIAELDNMADKLGHRNYENLDKLARKSLESQDDPKSWIRRNQMVEYFAHALHDAQINVFMTDPKKIIVQGVISDAMRYFFAMEAGSSYLGEDFIDLESNIASYIQDGVDKEVIKEKSANDFVVTDVDKLSLWEIRERDGQRMVALQSNTKALNSYRVIACNITKETENSSPWNEYRVDPLSSKNGKDLFGNEIETSDSKSSDLSDGETACYPCPLCGGEVKRQGSDLVCQKNPEQHHIKYQSQAD